MTEDLFGHLDDPVPPAATPETMHGVVARGRTLRSRRYSLMAAAGAAIVVSAVGIGMAAASGAHHSAYDGVDVPGATAPTGSPSPMATPPPRATPPVVAAPRHTVRQPTGNTVTVPCGAPRPAASPSASPAASPSDSPSPDSLPTDLPLATSPTPEPTSSAPAGGCPGATASPATSATPTDSASPAPAGSPTAAPTESPAPAPSASG